MTAQSLPARLLRTALEEVAETYEEIYVVLAPPRTASTVLARVLWEHELVGFYAHEPFDLVYHGGARPERACDAMLRPLDLRKLMCDPARPARLLVKEMTFQAARFAPCLIDLATHPIVFLLRDPRLAIASRMRMVGRGEPLQFRERESGWTDLADQVEYCRRHRIDYVVLDASEMRRDPDRVLGRLFAYLDLRYSPSLRHWQPVDVDLGSLGDLQRHWYERVLASAGIDAPDEPTPALDEFPADDGFRAHVELAFEIYRELRRDPHLIEPRERVAPTFAKASLER